jgi:hypothetical protein
MSARKKNMPRVAHHAGKTLQIAGAGQGVNIDRHDVGRLDAKVTKIGADETGSTCDHHHPRILLRFTEPTDCLTNALKLAALCQLSDDPEKCTLRASCLSRASEPSPHASE